MLFVGLLSSAAAAQRDDYTAPRDAQLDARDARSLRVEAKAGLLRIEGRSDLTEVRVRGTARASRESWLQDIQLRTDRRGDELQVIVDIPSWSWSGDGRAYKGLDLVIEIPSRLALDIVDGSGSIELRGVSAVRVHDGSGELEVVDAAGNIEIDDGSGEISLRGVQGDVRIEDGSGELRIDDVRGNVHILDDGSGSLTVTRVTGWVQVNEAGSGSVRVADVGGDLTVRDTRRSRVHYENVRGTVRIDDR
jgi:hypothetical protein